MEKHLKLLIILLQEMIRVVLLVWTWWTPWILLRVEMYFSLSLIKGSRNMHWITQLLFKKSTATTGHVQEVIGSEILSHYREMKSEMAEITHIRCTMLLSVITIKKMIRHSLMPSWSMPWRIIRITISKVIWKKIA